MVTLDDTADAFVPGRRTEQLPLGEGRLSGLTFAVKDNVDVAGIVTSCGSPDWERTHGPAPATAPIVLSLLDAGGWLVGKTRMVEMAYGLTGENAWHGTPRNPRALTRYPGGSSSGSAAAVAAGLVDVAIGTDTGGSVRIPASYCGVFGMRPTIGAISMAGVVPLAPGFDTPGWFTASAATLARVGDVVLPGGGGGVGGPLLSVREAWVNAGPDVAQVLRLVLERLEPRFGRAVGIQLAPEGLDTFYDHFRCVQAGEVWSSLGGWIRANHPQFGPGVAERFAAAETMDPAQCAAGQVFRRMAQTRIRPLLGGGAVLVFPTSPCPAPALTASRSELDVIREATIGVTAIAGLCGLPEITLPVADIDGAPVGLSLVGGVGRDRALLGFAQEVAAALDLPV